MYKSSQFHLNSLSRASFYILMRVKKFKICIRPLQLKIESKFSPIKKPMSFLLFSIFIQIDDFICILPNHKKDKILLMGSTLTFCRGLRTIGELSKHTN